jgi:hypothetical protein
VPRRELAAGEAVSVNEILRVASLGPARPARFALTWPPRWTEVFPRTVPNQPKHRSSAVLDPWDAAVHEATHDLILFWIDAETKLLRRRTVAQYARSEIPTLSVDVHQALQDGTINPQSYLRWTRRISTKTEPLQRQLLAILTLHEPLPDEREAEEGAGTGLGGGVELGRGPRQSFKSSGLYLLD